LAYTYFFRDLEILEAIGSIVAPWAATHAEIKVWDAGCASGEEPYSLAIIFAERLDPFTIRNLRILATDREESSFPQFEDKINLGHYQRHELIWVPEALRGLYFEPTDAPDTFSAAPVLRDCIRFLRHDLLSLEPVDSGFDLVVCKNTLMHCPPDEVPLVVDMFHGALRPGGFLAFDCFQPLPPANEAQFEQVEPGLQLFRKR
jgi:chemotaxis protein methyltransferase CheR